MATFVMVNGIPGNMGKIVAGPASRGLSLCAVFLTGEIIPRMKTKSRAG